MSVPVYELLCGYKSMLQNDFMRFWDKAFDAQYGGYFTCYSNDGSTLVSTDKYIWSQGRMLWIDARYAELIKKGVLAGDADERLSRARKTYGFLKKNAILPDGEGVCAYLCEQDGTKKESIPGKGYYTSFYVDCFVIMGYAEYSRVSGEEEPLLAALSLYERMRAYLDRGEIVSEPYPIPAGFLSHSVPMILSNVLFVLYDALKALSHPRYPEFLSLARANMEHILTAYFDEQRRVIREIVPISPADEDTFLARHVNPGHAIESMWFCLKVLGDTGWDDALAKRMYDVVKNSLAYGWDDEMGGLLRIAGYRGGKPDGRMLDVPYDRLLMDTWDSKLWWPHSEALYVTLLCGRLSGDAAFDALYEKLSAYIFRVFPNPDREIGEWIQILGRDGRQMDKIVALPVKDPYHIMRNFMLIIELLDESLQKARRG